MDEKKSNADIIREIAVKVSTLSDEQLAELFTWVDLCPRSRACLDRYANGHEPTDADCEKCTLNFCGRRFNEFAGNQNGDGTA